MFVLFKSITLLFFCGGLCQIQIVDEYRPPFQFSEYCSKICAATKCPLDCTSHHYKLLSHDDCNCCPTCIRNKDKGIERACACVMDISCHVGDCYGPDWEIVYTGGCCPCSKCVPKQRLPEDYPMLTDSIL